MMTKSKMLLHGILHKASIVLLLLLHLQLQSCTHALVYIWDAVADEDDPGPSESMIDKKQDLPSADAGFALL